MRPCNKIIGLCERELRQHWLPVPCPFSLSYSGLEFSAPQIHSAQSFCCQLQYYIPQFVVGRYKVNLTENTQDDKLDKDAMSKSILPVQIGRYVTLINQEYNFLD